uniref:Uncharacterized protein n=1 Tax=virus sp. ctML55 TaxID=2827627 RepID=A0A8S5RIE8_9VIRU|nr:MAG TPA: hypothetical protein [virus sp. ctML55]
MHFRVCYARTKATSTDLRLLALRTTNNVLLDLSLSHPLYILHKGSMQSIVY